MKFLHRRNLITLAALTLLLILAMPFTGIAQGRGRGRGQGSSVWDRKCEKFVNCHDARDGRWDNRGPRRTTTYSIFRRNRRHNADDYSRNRDWRRQHSNDWRGRR